jgi:hypothetical protein
MAYRNDLDALEARYQALEDELAGRTRARDEVAHMLAEARARAQHEAVLADLAAGGPARRRRERATLAAVVTAAALIVGGLGYWKSLPSFDDRMETVLHEMSELTDEVCACRDRACADAAVEHLQRWSEQKAREWTPQDVHKINPEAMTRAMALSRRLGACLQAAMANGANAQQAPQAAH